MSDDLGRMPEPFIDRPEAPFVQIKVKDLKPKHGGWMPVREMGFRESVGLAIDPAG